MTVQVPIKSEAPLNPGSIRLEVSGIEKISIVLLPGDPTGSARAAAQKRAYTLQVTGTVAESARDTARIDAVRYKLEGSGKEEVVRLGEKGGGILLKDMTQKPRTPERMRRGCQWIGLSSRSCVPIEKESLIFNNRS